MRADPAAVAAALFGADGSPRVGRRVSAAERLAGYLERAELYHAPDGRAYATIEIDRHAETWPVRSRRFRGWLTDLHYRATGKPAPSQAMTETLALADVRALAGPEHTVSIRVGEAEGRVYLDLGDRAWRAVEVDADGWRVVERCPIRFRRAAGMLPLPEPARGGTVEELRPFVNMEDDRDWHLTLAWLVMALAPWGPYPVLVPTGEHGSGKSWTANRLRDLVDPNEAASRAEPREPRDLVIAARNSWILSLDNVSSLPGWLSDGLCRLATGSGFATRELFTDEDEVLFTATRPMIVNGIGDVVTRSDLLDRSLLVTLQPIPDERRRDERELLRGFADVRPRVLGALLDAVSAALRDRDRITLNRAPRMADFAHWAAAAESALGWAAGTFAAAYAASRGEAHELALDGSPVAVAVRGLLAEVETWQGTAAELLGALGGRVAESVRRGRDWPGTGRGLSSALRRVAPNLRAVGVEVRYHREARTGRRLITITTQRAGSTVTTVTTVTGRASSGDAGDDGDGVPTGVTMESGPPSSRNSAPHRAGDDGDDGDDEIPALSCRLIEPPGRSYLRQSMPTDGRARDGE